MKKRYLVRKQTNDPGTSGYSRILGPFTVTEVLSMAKNGGLNQSSEAAAQNEYWFFLSELDEVKKNFFVDALPFQMESSSEEITQPDVTSSEKTPVAIIPEEISTGENSLKSLKNKVEPSQVFTFFMALLVLLCFMSFVWLLRYLRAG